MTLPQITALSLRYSEQNNNDLPGIHIMRVDTPTPVEAVVYNPVICLILQGAKDVTIGTRTVTAQAGDALLVSHDVPVISKITQASAAQPYLALILSLDVSLVRGLYDQLGDTLSDTAEARALNSMPADSAWVTPLARYLSLMDDPLAAQVLGPATLREIHFRLLTSPIGGMLRNLLLVSSHASRIARAILRIRAEFSQPLPIQSLAQTAGMSASSFHEHFKSVTGTSPLQYLKDLRLIEARSLLRSGQHSVSSISFDVGYESPNHFSRDYLRKFGHPPSQDLRTAPAPA